MKFDIQKITLYNYRQYQYEQVLSFTNNPKKNVSIILGKNGSGKSNLLNALTWCFYGIEVHKENAPDNYSGLPIINTHTLQATPPDESAKAEVKVLLGTRDGQWTIKRTIEAYKNDKGELYYDGKPKLSVVYPQGQQDKIAEGEETQRLINNLLPEALRNFFFIDGEQLREFFKHCSSDAVSRAIDNISQLELVYQSGYHLKEFERKLSRSVSNTTPKLKKVQDKIDSLKTNIEVKNNKKNQIEVQIADLENSLHDVEKYLKEHSVAAVSQLQKEREDIEKDISHIENEIDDQIRKRNSYLLDIAPFIYIYNDLQATHQLIKESLDKGELPPRIKETFIRELLERGKCICGNEIDSETQETLENYAKNAVLSELNEVAISGKITIESLLAEIKKFPDEIKKFEDTISDFNERYEEKKNRLEYISTELRDHDVEEIRLYEDRRNNLSIDLGGKRHELKIIETDIKNMENELKKSRDDELNEIKKSEKNQYIRRKYDLVKSALDVLEDIEGYVKEKIQSQVEEKTKEYFQTLIRKKDAFEDISIDENYEVCVLDKYGYNVINNLSAGEYMILGLSFMGALMTISGFHAPVIIDTPLAKIDDEHRDHITKELPKFLEGTQLILLVTPTEYDEKVKSNLDNFILSENKFEIVEDQSKTVSEVISNGW